MTYPTTPSYLYTFSVPTPFPVGPVNLYLAEGEPLTLLDAGPRYDPARKALTEALAERGYRVADLQRLILTHAHPDHCGLAAELVRESGAEVMAHAETGRRLAPGAEAQRVAFYADVMRWAGVPMEVLTSLAGARQGASHYTEPVTLDRALADGDTLQLGGEDWRVLHTPGHTGDLICLYQPQRRLLLSGDHLLRDISSNPLVEPPAPGQTERPRRLVEYMAQLRRVAEMDIALTLPGHGPPITDHRALIRERLAFHEKRARHILETMGDEALTTHEIVSQLFSGLDPINHFLAISEVIGHLQWLEVEGRVTRREQGGVARWRGKTRY
ncbi:MAG: Zn-dependent hydrolase [Chloroflexi bacterium]|nr:MAG: Zn-dependent hydrolase [Chloroflexota bacterium]RLC76808.1 MAG: Zn-dependent hydrolase [Chloroflexota bacterium]